MSNREKATAADIKPGAKVWIWWDTGAFGPTPCTGEVLSVAPKTFVVRWQSGIEQRLFFAKHLHLVHMGDFDAPVGATEAEVAPQGRDAGGMGSGPAARHAESKASSGFKSGVAVSDQLPTLDELDTLMNDYGERSFACGAWDDSDDDEPEYDVRMEDAEIAHDNLWTAIKKLLAAAEGCEREAGVGGGVKSAGEAGVSRPEVAPQSAASASASQQGAPSTSPSLAAAASLREDGETKKRVGASLRSAELRRAVTDADVDEAIHVYHFGGGEAEHYAALRAVLDNFAQQGGAR